MSVEQNKTSRYTLSRVFPWVLIIAGIVGLLCSLILTADHIALLRNPTADLGCDINPVVSCGTVINSKESELFGLPNPVYGIAAFSVLITTGVILLAKAKLPRWYWLGLQAGSFVGVLLIAYLFYHSVFVINALCPFCIIVWVCTITVFWYTLLQNIALGHIKLPAKYNATADFARRHHLDILITFILVIAAVILQHFWYYYGRFFGQ